MDSATILRLLISVAAILCLILVHLTPAKSEDGHGPRNRTAQDVLEFYNLPKGILPQGVKGYNFDNITGKFLVYLDRACIVTVVGDGIHKLRYQTIVKGILSNGRLSKVEGITMRFYLTWMNILQIVGLGDYVNFYVNGGNAGFPVEHFEDTPRCGNGMNQARKLMEIS